MKSSLTIYDKCSTAVDAKSRAINTIVINTTHTIVINWCFADLTNLRALYIYQCPAKANMPAALISQLRSQGCSVADVD